MPEHTFISESKTTMFINELSREIRYKNIADPKNPIELTLFLTFKTVYPFLISPSAKYPPITSDIIETMLGIRIAIIKVLDAKSIPIPP